MNKFLIFFLFLTISLSAQIKGVVKDSLSGEPIAYAAVMYEDSKIGVNTDEKGYFELPKNDTLQYIQISNLGYYPKRVLRQNNLKVNLTQKLNLLDEIILVAKQNTKELKIGEIKKTNSGFGNGGTSHMWGKLFKYDENFKDCIYLKEVKFITKSRIKNAKLKLRIFTIDSLNVINEDLLTEDLIINCKKGKQIHTIDVSKYNIILSHEGIMIGFENLIIEENKFEYNYTMEGKKGKFKGVSYEPTIKGFIGVEANVYSISNNKAYLFDIKPKNTEGFHDLSLRITLTN